MPPGAPTVLIAGQPAANAMTMHVCTIPGTPPVVHPPMPAGAGFPTVLIGGAPAMRLGDPLTCGAVIVMGAPTVLIGG